MCSHYCLSHTQATSGATGGWTKSKPEAQCPAHEYEVAALSAWSLSKVKVRVAARILPRPLPLLSFYPAHNEILRRARSKTRPNYPLTNEFPPIIHDLRTICTNSPQQKYRLENRRQDCRRGNPATRGVTNRFGESVGAARGRFGRYLAVLWGRAGPGGRARWWCGALQPGNQPRLTAVFARNWQQSCLGALRQCSNTLSSHK